MNYYWTKEEVLDRLDTKMTLAFNSVYEMAERENVSMRDAAYMVAIGRVVKSMELRAGSKSKSGSNQLVVFQPEMLPENHFFYPLEIPTVRFLYNQINKW